MSTTTAATATSSTSQQSQQSQQQEDHPSYATGTFCWNELASKDVEAAKKFYVELFGWKTKDGDFGTCKYTEILTNDGTPIGGMYQMTEEYGDMNSHWMPYVAVTDVDETARRVEDLGGKVCVQPTDMPTVGRFAVINDPSGAVMSIIKLGV